MNIHHSPPFLSAAMAVAAPLNNPRPLLRPMKLAKSPSFSSSRLAVCFCSSRTRTAFQSLNATSTGTSLTDETSDSSADVFFNDTFPLKRPQKVEGKIFVSLNQLELTVGCNLPGKWILHWGVSYVDDISGSGWDQPPKDMMPPGSVPIKDYAVDTPLVKSSEVDALYQVKIKFKSTCRIAAIHFLLKDEETGSWYQCREKDFKFSLVDYLQNDGNLVEEGRGFELWPGSLGKLFNIVLKPEASPLNDEEGSMISIESEIGNRKLKGFYEELPVTKEVFVGNLVSVSAKKCSETARSILTLETDIPGDVIVHWGVCKDGSKRWEIPAVGLPLETTIFKNKALHTRLQPKCDGNGSRGLFVLDGEYDGFLFMLKVDGDSWLKWRGNDFYIPLSVCSSRNQSDSTQVSGETAEENEEFYSTAYTDGMISGIRNLISGFSSENSVKIKKKEAQESILQEIEKLAAEAYRFFRGSVPSVTPETVSETEAPESSPRICSGTGTGFEIMCQCFNWESHKSGRWYAELKEKASEIASLGFTVVWLPPPTDSVSPEGYMPRDLYNLNSRYGSLDELKGLVKRLHEVGLKVLGDAVLNHRCAQYQNQNGVWNIFGGRLNWDDRAVVQDDPHFQGRGNKSSGDSFHAAPNIDHSQEFVRKDLKEWLCWLRKEVGYDGWRLDFVRGFWGGYVKDYMEASEPCFAVGEYWDSLSYTYSDMDYNQDAHRQRIIDWINGTGGMAGAFDVTTKGILHTALERCEYWRLSDEKGEPPGVVGWWPSRAVTFIENHDTGSTQGHWRFPKGKEMQGYAYILTHPGTPAVFYDHLFSPYRSQIGALISLRNRNKIHCRSTIKIVKVERDVYAAIINEKVAMKIGAGKYEPAKGPQSWSPAVEGHDYKVWESC